MMAPLRKIWEARAPRERTIVVVLALAIGVALYVWLVQSAERQGARLHTSVTSLRVQAARLEQQAAELGRLRAAPAIAVSPTDLRSLVQSQIGAAGLAAALTRIDAQDADQVSVVFGAVGFADWLNWVSSLRVQQVRLDSCRIEALLTPGMVSVTATLARPKYQ